MNIQKVRGAVLFTIGIASLLGGCAFYFLIIGVFEMVAAIIGLGAFVALAVVVWTRSDDESLGSLNSSWSSTPTSFRFASHCGRLLPKPAARSSYSSPQPV